jgi:hypothetical protein
MPNAQYVMTVDCTTALAVLDRYRIVGHSGDSNEIPFVDLDKPPQSAKDQLKVLESMVSFNAVYTSYYVFDTTATSKVILCYTISRFHKLWSVHNAACRRQPRICCSIAIATLRVSMSTGSTCAVLQQR